MKKTAPLFAAFLLGAIVGMLIAPAFFQWLASALGDSPVALSPADPFAVRSRFALGCGVLFASAVIFSGSLRRFAGYLAFGVLASTGAAVFYHAGYASTAALMPAGWPGPVLSMQDLPALRVPLFGAFGVSCLALALRFFPGGTRTQSTANDHTA